MCSACYNLFIMKLDLRNYEIGKHYNLDLDLDFTNHTFSQNYRIRRINSCHLKMDLVVFEYITDIKLTMHGEVVGACSYTNEDVLVPYKVKENMTFSSDPDSTADYYEPNSVFELDPYLLALIDSSVPLNIIKKGAKLPDNGESYQVLSEEEYLAQKKSKGDSRWAALDDLDLD